MNKIPYFELKVVKVKKEEKRECIGEICIRGKRQPLYIEDDRIYYKGTKEKGNWVNGECINKIKFPCFCSYSPDRGIGILTKSDIGGEFRYELHKITEQDYSLCGCSRVAESNCIYELIRVNNIHILKGKIIIFEEEE